MPACHSSKYKPAKLHSNWAKKLTTERRMDKGQSVVTIVHLIYGSFGGLRLSNLPIMVTLGSNEK